MSQNADPVDPPTAKITRVRRARNSLSRDEIVDAALELVAVSGLEALNMARLAETVGASPMALYWHIRNKAELVAEV